MNSPSPRRDWSRCIALVGLGACLLAGTACATPEYSPAEDGGGGAQDAGADAAALRLVPDAGDSVLPIDAGSAARAKLTGTYALIARSLGNDATQTLGWFSEDLVAFGDIREEQGQLLLRYQVCSSRTTLSPALLPKVTGYTLNGGTGFPERELELVLADDGSFSTRGQPMIVGYEELSSTACPVGTRVSHPERPWLPQGSCLCTDPSLLPTSSEDCRVTDPDGDMEPAITIRWSTNTDAYTLEHDASQFVNGKIDKNQRHTAQYRRDAEVYQLACSAGSCNRQSATVCPAEKNPAQFVPLLPPAPGQPAWSCDQVLKQIDATGGFGLDPPSTPKC